MNAVLTAIIPISLLFGGLVGCAPESTDDVGVPSGKKVMGETIVATVNGSAIYDSDVAVAAQAQSLIDAGEPFLLADTRYKTVLDELIDQRLLAMDAVSQAIDQETDAKRRLAAARERVLGNLRVDRHLRETVNETNIRRMYEEQAKLAARGDEIRARHILVETKDKAESLRVQILNGADFAALAKANSIDAGSAEGGGDLGYFTADMLSEVFTKPVFAAKKGEIIGPVKSEYGWHIARVLDRRPAPQPTFDAMRPKIVNFMTFDAIQDLMTDLRDGAQIDIKVDTPPNDNGETDVDTTEETDGNDE